MSRTPNASRADPHDAADNNVRQSPSSNDQKKTALFRQSRPTLEGIGLVEEAISLLRALPGRAPDLEGNPGGLVDFPNGLRPIVIGDLHANRDHLRLILNHDGNRADLV